MEKRDIVKLVIESAVDMINSGDIESAEKLTKIAQKISTKESQYLPQMQGLNPLISPGTPGPSLNPMEAPEESDASINPLLAPSDELNPYNMSDRVQMQSSEPSVGEGTFRIINVRATNIEGVQNVARALVEILRENKHTDAAFTDAQIKTRSK